MISLWLCQKGAVAPLSLIPFQNRVLSCDFQRQCTPQHLFRITMCSITRNSEITEVRMVQHCVQNSICLLPAHKKRISTATLRIFRRYIVRRLYCLTPHHKKSSYFPTLYHSKALESTWPQKSILRLLAKKTRDQNLRVISSPWKSRRYYI